MTHNRFSGADGVDTERPAMESFSGHYSSVTTVPATTCGTDSGLRGQTVDLRLRAGHECAGAYVGNEQAAGVCANPATLSTPDISRPLPPNTSLMIGTVGW